MEAEYVQCSSCGEEIAEKTNFCPNCGAKNEKVLTRCRSCGNVLTETDKFCPSCGTKRYKGGKKLFVIGLITLISFVFFLIMGFFVIIANDSETVPATPPPVEVTEPVSEPEILFKPDINLFRSIIEDLLGSSFDFCVTSGDEANFYIGVGTDGFADTMITSKNAGYDENFGPWVEVKNAMLEMYSNIHDTAMMHGLYDTKITLMFLNDTNHDKALLIIQDGVVSYDFLAN